MIDRESQFSAYGIAVFISKPLCSRYGCHSIEEERRKGSLLSK